MTNWLDSLFGKEEISKEASVTPVGKDSQDTTDRKIKASGWMLDVASIDPDQVDKEYNETLAAEAKMLGKTAAYEAFESTEETLKRDYMRDVKILSDYALAEMLMDIRGNKEQNLQEKHTELKEKAKADVKASREKAEKEVLEHVGMSAQLDWKAAFDKYTKEAKPEEPKEKDLFQPKLEKIDEKEWSTGKKDDKDFVISDKEKKEKEGIGNGREEDERTDVTKQPGELQDKKASLKIDAFLVRDPDTELVKGAKITLARSVMAMNGTILNAGSDYEITGMEGERYVLTANGKSYEIARFDTPKFFRTAALGKKADYSGWTNFETWNVALWIDNEQGLQEEVLQIARTATDPYKLGNAIESMLEEFMPDLGASMWSDMLNAAWREVNWMEIGEHFIQKESEIGAESSLKIAEKVKDNADKDKGNQALPEGKETAGDKPEEAVKTTTLPADKKEVGDKADRAEEKNSLDKGNDVDTIEAVNKKAHNGTDHVAEMCPVCGGPGEDLGNLGQRDHFRCQGCGINFSHEKEASCGHCGSMEEIKSCATKAEVLKIIKEAEVQSPWIIVEKDGQEMIARRETIPSVNKESEEDLEKELQK